MANTKSAKKRARQTPKRTARNSNIKSKVKTAMRSAREAITSNAKDAQSTLVSAISTIAKAGKKGTLHKRTAARRISRLMKAQNTARKAPPAAAKTTRGGASKKA